MDRDTQRHSIRRNDKIDPKEKTSSYNTNSNFNDTSQTFFYGNNNNTNEFYNTNVNNINGMQNPYLDYNQNPNLGNTHKINRIPRTQLVFFPENNPFEPMVVEEESVYNDKDHFVKTDTTITDIRNTTYDDRDAFFYFNEKKRERDDWRNTQSLSLRDNKNLNSRIEQEKTVQFGQFSRMTSNDIPTIDSKTSILNFIETDSSNSHKLGDLIDKANEKYKNCFDKIKEISQLLNSKSKETQSLLGFDEEKIKDENERNIKEIKNKFDNKIVYFRQMTNDEIENVLNGYLDEIQGEYDKLVEIKEKISKSTEIIKYDKKTEIIKYDKKEAKKKTKKSKKFIIWISILSSLAALLLIVGIVIIVLNYCTDTINWW